MKPQEPKFPQRPNDRFSEEDLEMPAYLRREAQVPLPAPESPDKIENDPEFKSIPGRKTRETLSEWPGESGVALFNKFIGENNILEPELATLEDLTLEQRRELGKLILVEAGVQTSTDEEDNSVFAELLEITGKRIEEEKKKFISEKSQKPAPHIISEPEPAYGYDKSLGRSVEYSAPFIYHEPTMKMPGMEGSAENPDFKKTEENETKIKRLEEVIATVTQRLAEIDRELKIDYLQTELEKKRKELKNDIFGKGEKREKIASLEIELDKIENPFKWFIINKDNLSRKNFRIMFGVDRDSATLRDINQIMGETGQDFEKRGFIWSATDETFKTDNVVLFSANGFYLKLINAREVKGGNKKMGEVIKNPNARYVVIDPDGNELSSYIRPYEEGMGLLLNKAREYHLQQLTLFKNQD
jgi:hypothetical protein